MQPGTCVECGRKAAWNSNKCSEHEDPAQARNRRRLIRRIVWAVGIVVAIVVVGYVVPVLDREQVSSEEYAVRICGVDALHDGATWGEAREYGQSRLSEHKKLEPPGELASYHESRIEALEGFLDAVRGKDSNAIMNAFELVLDPDAMRSIRATEAGKRSLSLEDHRLLRQHGCVL